MATDMLSEVAVAHKMGTVENRIMMLTDMEIDKSGAAKTRLFSKIKENSTKNMFTTFIGTLPYFFLLLCLIPLFDSPHFVDIFLTAFYSYVVFLHKIIRIFQELD